MKRTKPLRTLEELWELEDQHPLVDATAGGLLRWMYATGMLARPSERETRSRSGSASSRRDKNGGH